MAEPATTFDSGPATAFEAKEARTQQESAPPTPEPYIAAQDKDGPAAQKKAAVKAINLALQGGGAHGAFAWGVLDHLLEDGRIRFEAISATSAGAMNGAVCAYGMLMGGSDGARQALNDFWRGVSDAAARYSPIRSNWWDAAAGNFSLDGSPFYHFYDMLSRVYSPYQLNPFNFNPLKQVLEAHVDFNRLRQAKADAIQLHLCATNVETGKVRIFNNDEVTADAVLASACLPHLFRAVEIGGEYYWDGGYIGNPAIFPLIYDSKSRDVVVVHINPIVRKGCPTTAAEIMNRLNEVSFNSSLLREMRAIAFVSHLIDTGKVREGEMKRMLIHSIRVDDFMAGLGVSSKLNADWNFLVYLRDMGRKAAAAWLQTSFDRIGVASTIDLREEFL